MSNKQDSQLVINDIQRSELEESIRKLSIATEEQFDVIKHEKWYTRLLDTITFSRKGEIRLAGQISTLAQAQQFVALYLLKESQHNKELSDLVNNNSSYIEKLAGRSVRFKKELTSLSNLMLLLNEINNGEYNRYKPITAMCLILAQLDNEVLYNRRAIHNILLSLYNHNVLNGENIEIIDFLMDVADICEYEVPVVYAELSLIRSNYFANLVLLLIEALFFSKDCVHSKDDVVLSIAIANNIEKKYDSTTLISIFVSFINSVIALKENEGDFIITNPSAKQEREEAERLFLEGKLIEAYPMFVHAADSGDARACYFAASYYYYKYGITGESEELYKKYINLGIKRRDPLCYLEYSRDLYRQGEYKKAENWRNSILKRVGILADRGDAVACHLVAQTFFSIYLDVYLLQKENKENDWSKEEKGKTSAYAGIFKNYSSKALEAGYWLAAYRRCFTVEPILLGENCDKCLEKYGWYFENVEWANIQMMLGCYYIALDITEGKYYKNAAACFVKAYKLQKENSICGYISFFLNAGAINESKSDGIEKSKIKLLYYKGLDSDDPGSLRGLGDLYYWGVGYEHLGKNRASAFVHYEKAYERYHDDSSYSPGKSFFDSDKAYVAYKLGHMTFNGVGTKQDTKKAVFYYQEAVRKGEKKAIKPLANCYKNGTGVNQDMNRYNELMSLIENE